MARKLLLIQSVSTVVLMLVFPASAPGVQMKAFQMREDFGTVPLSDCSLQYYYDIPCPTYSWFWAFTIGPPIIWGAFFEIGDVSMSSGSACSPADFHTLETIRVLDFAGYGTLYPGHFTVEFDVYCSDEEGCPVGPSLWNSGPWETHFGWNYVAPVPPLCITSCCTDPGPPPVSPRILVTATHTGTEGYYPAWGFDNISAPIETGCEMHDVSCLPVLYPRPYNSHYSTVHSGIYGLDVLSYCPPIWLTDYRDTTSDYSQFGAIEIAWRVYLSSTGPTGAEPATWGDIKSIYR
jgi:hypothetical protein